MGEGKRQKRKEESLSTASQILQRQNKIVFLLWIAIYTYLRAKFRWILMYLSLNLLSPLYSVAVWSKCVLLMFVRIGQWPTFAMKTVENICHKKNVVEENSSNDWDANQNRQA